MQAVKVGLPPRDLGTAAGLHMSYVQVGTVLGVGVRRLPSYGCRARVQSEAGWWGEGIDRECPAEPPGASPASFAPFQNVRERATAHSGAKTHGMLLKRRLWLLSES